LHYFSDIKIDNNEYQKHHPQGGNISFEETASTREEDILINNDKI